MISDAFQYCHQWLAGDTSMTWNRYEAPALPGGWYQAVTRRHALLQGQAIIPGHPWVGELSGLGGVSLKLIQIVQRIRTASSEV